MGKGDKKSKRGKIIMGTYGVRRSKKKNGLSATTQVHKEESKKPAVDKVKPKEKKKAPKKVEEGLEKITEIVELTVTDEKPATGKPAKITKDKTEEKAKKGKSDSVAKKDAEDTKQ